MPRSTARVTTFNPRLVAEGRPRPVPGRCERSRLLRRPARRCLLRHDPQVLKLIETVGVSSPRWIVDPINLKAPRVGTGFPRHQDTTFVAWQQRDAIAKYGGANLVIALDRADEGNDGFEVLCGTHAGGAVHYDASRQMQASSTRAVER
jgi:hypothetical protein